MSPLTVLLLATFLVCCHGASRMLGGEEVPIENIPFQASVEAVGVHWCSAAILSSKYALLTANCAEDFNADVGIATFRLGTTSRNYDGTPYKCSNVWQHPKFNASLETNDYDIAVAEIFPEITLSAGKISTIPLIDGSPAVGANGTLSGWGSIQDGGAIMIYARARTVTVTAKPSCKTTFQDVRPVTDRMLCAAGDQNGGGVICDGDRGSLFVIDGKLAALASWGDGCTNNTTPDVYVDITNDEIRGFIRNMTGI